MTKSLLDISTEYKELMKSLRNLAREADLAGVPFRGYVQFEGNTVNSYEVSGGPEEYEESYEVSDYDELDY